jgi:ribonucleotide monophosphatase NagD (HAD superfamily)
VTLARDLGRLAAVGDALATDIAGGRWHLGPGGAVLVAHGIHSEELGVPAGGGLMPKTEAVEALMRTAAAAAKDPGAAFPTHVVPAFVWK